MIQDVELWSLIEACAECCIDCDRSKGESAKAYLELAKSNLKDALAALVAENERLREACASGWGEPTLINQLRAECDALLPDAQAWRNAVAMVEQAKADGYSFTSVGIPDDAARAAQEPRT